MNRGLRLLLPLILGIFLLTPCTSWAQTTPVQPQELAPAQVEEYKEQSKQLVSFLEYMMNVLGNPKATTQQKETVITQSYTKAFRDAEVQIEDDLDEERSVVTNKNVQAYLKDINFFFRQAKFELNINDISYYVTDNGQVFFRVTVNRNLQGTTINGDTVNANKVRYIEINLDKSDKDLKIASVYTTKLSEREELANWWSEVPEAWRTYFKERIGAGAYDSIGYRGLLEIVRLTQVDISSNQNIQDLSPIGKLVDLKHLDISGTWVNDLVPLRNLTKLETLICSSTTVGNLEPLKYATSLRVLDCENTRVSDLSILSSFSKLEKLYCSGTKIRQLVKIPGLKDLRCASTAIINLAPVAEMNALVYLDCSQTSIADLQPLSNAAQLQWLNIETTPVENLAPLDSLNNLQVLICNNTPVQNLEVLGGLASLQKVYCDNTAITKKEANQFMAAHPEVLVIYESGQLQTWWNALPMEWKKVFQQYVSVDTLTKETLAQIANLTEVDISGNKNIMDLSPLTELTNLQVLQCANTNVTSLEPLSEMVNLQLLNCSNTLVESLEALGNARSLRILNIDRTGVSSLIALNDLSGIQRLSCEHTNIPEGAIVNFIQTHPGTIVIYKTDQLSLWWNSLPSAWKEVFREQVAVGDIPDREQLHELVFLKTLTIEENTSITSLEPLREFVGLTELGFSNTPINSLEPLRGMTTLRALICARSPIRDLDPLSSLPNLVYLDCQNTPVEDLRPLKDLIELETLKCSGTQVDDLRPLSDLINLKRLECFNTDVKRLKPLKGLYNLQELHCYNTRVSSREVDRFREWNPDCKVVYY